MLLALLALALIAAALLAVSAGLRALDAAGRRRAARSSVGRGPELRDPGRERRAEQRARELLRSCVNEEEWAMYRDLGFIRVLGRGTVRDVGQADRAPRSPVDAAGEDARGAVSRPRLDTPANGRNSPARGPGGAYRAEFGAMGAASAGDRETYAYLIYPHKPIVAYLPSSGRLLNEYCVEFPDLTQAISQSRLPDSDDVLAKWMALTGDERRLIRNANMHLPGRQIDPTRVKRDLWRLSEWERQRRGFDSVEARQP